VHAAAPQHQRHLARQHHVAGVRDTEQTAGEQPLHGSGGARAAHGAVGVRHLTHGRPPGEPVEHGADAARRLGEQALDDVGAAEVLGEPGEGGAGIAGRGQPQVLEQVGQPLGRAPAERVGERGPEPGRVGAEDVAGGAHELLRPRRSPDEAEPAQALEHRSGRRSPQGRHRSRRGRFGQRREHLEHLQRRGVQPVERPLHRQPARGPDAEARQVRRQRDRQVRPVAQQRGETRVRAGPQLVGEAARRGAPSGGHRGQLAGAAARHPAFRRLDILLTVGVATDTLRTCASAS
jgi:hypothetical protein